MNHRYLSQSIRLAGNGLEMILSAPSSPGSRRARAVAVAIFALAVLTLATGAANGALRSFELSQTAMLEDTPTAIRAYARVLDERNEPVFRLEDATITASLGEYELSLDEMKSFQQSDEGVAYIFMVDISRSLSVNEFALIQASLENWMVSLRPQDRAAILAFGSESRLVVDFTNDVSELRESVQALGPTDDSTVFFEALHNGFELARRRDPALPGRRALLVLTDGRDEGSGWSFDDVLAALKDDPTPIYAIGLSRIRNRTERGRYLQLLRRLSTNSGGAFFEGSTDNLASLYASIREAIHNVWVFDFSCPDCRRDGESYRLQVNLSEGERVLSDGQKIRLLPPAMAAGAALPSEPATPSSPDSTPAEETVAAEDASTVSGWGWPWPLLPLLAAAAAGWLMWQRRATGAITPEPDLPDVDLSVVPRAEPVEAQSFTTPTGVMTTRPPRPVKLRVVRLIVVRGKQPGRTYNVTLLEKAVVGARSTCDCVLLDEPGTSPEQFEFFQMDGHVFIRNLSKDHPTLVDGLPTDDHQRIQTEALVGTRDFIVRVIFGEGRATART
ncbi:MAG: VWA domain-containing protein [Thermoanaerobaculia bacterium]